jgi:hypothetical protein
MKLIVSIFVLSVSINCSAQGIALKSDTLLKKKNVMLYLANGLAITPFAVSGDLYLTPDLFVFHPKPYRGKRFEMHNNLIKDIKLPYDSIIVSKKTGAFGFKIKTKTEKYKISDSNNWGRDLRATVALINRLRKEHKAK